MILIDINTSSNQPYYLQIITQIGALIDNGGLRTGDRLPPTRQLAQQLGVHRSTVVRAYDELWALGYLHSRQGAYSTVRQKVKITQVPHHRQPGDFQWQRALSEPAVKAISQVWPSSSGNAKTEAFDFESFELDPRMIPLETIRKSINHALCDEGTALLQYGPSAGYGPLRELIARRLAVHAIHVEADEILITHGAQHGLDIVLRMLTSPGDAIVVEDPTYGLFLPLATAHGVRTLGVPMQETGLDLDKLELLLHQHDVKLIYTMPNFHNPTGITTDQAHRERLLQLCETHNVIIIEDAFDEEMKYFGRVPLPIKSMDKKGLVLYLGTFSKVLSPGMRLGWIAAPKPCIEPMTQFRRALDLSSPLPLQAALTRLLRRDDFEKHIKRLHRAFRHRMQTAIRVLKTELPEAVLWHPPSGGYLLWLTLSGLNLPEAKVINTLANGGVRVSPGSRFTINPTPWVSLRLSISQRDETEIEQGLTTLCHLLQTLYQEAQS